MDSTAHWSRRNFVIAGSGLYLSTTRSAWSSIPPESKLQRWSSLDPASRYVSHSTGIEFDRISGDTFEMGSPTSESGRTADETPHSVVIRHPFWIARSVVTQKVFQHVMDSNPSFFAGRDSHPVERISWFDAVVCCNRLSTLDRLEPCYDVSEIRRGSLGIDDARVLRNEGAHGYRLPTEAEWELACRTLLTTHTSQKLGTSVVLDEATKEKGTKPIDGTTSGDPLTMGGNVWEWCSDWYGPYDSAVSENPRGPASGSQRVVRGGGWFSSWQQLRAACRGHDIPSIRSPDIGFRIVLPFSGSARTNSV